MDIFEKTRGVAAEVIALKGATVYAPGNAVATMLESTIKDKKLVIPVSALLEGEYGVSDVCIGVPAVIGAGGIERIIELKLDGFEQDIFNKGVTNVKEAIKALPL
jgi:malate dehydrogenase